MKKNTQIKGGYYAVRMAVLGAKIPYIVFASSEQQAARVIKKETGYAPAQYEVEGPY